MHWIDLLIHSAAILAAANGLSRVPRGLSPTHRHRLLLAGFALLMIWPLLSAIVPPVHLPLWPTGHTRGSIMIQQTALIPRTQAVISYFPRWPAIIWITGVLLALAPIALSHLTVFRIAYRATQL